MRLLCYSLMNVCFLFFLQKMQEFLINSPSTDLSILDLPDDNKLFSEALFPSSEITSSSCNIEPNCTYEEGSLSAIFSPCSPSFDALMEQQLLDTQVRELMGCLQEPTSQFLSTKEQHQQQPEQVVVMETATDVMLGNGDQQYDEYDINSMAHISEVPAAPPPHPQQSLIQHTYDSKEQFLQPMSSAAITGYSNMDADINDLYQGEMGLFACNGGQGQGRYPGGTVPMPMPMPMQMPMRMSMPMPLPEMECPNTTMRLYNKHDSFQQHGYGSTNMLGDRHLQQHQSLHNNSLVAGCNNITPMVSNISTLDESTFKIGRIPAEERKEKIKRYIKKRNQRNFSKKIKYTCRKTLADNRPRVRGRFAKNDELGETARTSMSNTNNLDCQDFDEVILAHITVANSFKYNGNGTLDSWI